MNRITATQAARRRRPASKARVKAAVVNVAEFHTTESEQPDAVERREMKAARWYSEYVPDRGWPPEDRPA